MRCQSLFIPSHDRFATDVDSALGGLGEHPSPGEMLAACVASCMLSMIAYTGKNKGFATEGISIRAACAEGSRGVGSLVFDVDVPMPAAPAVRRLMEGAAASCPVGNSLHPEVKKDIRWHWAD